MNNWRQFLDELPNHIADIIMDKVFEDQRPNITKNVVRYFEPKCHGFHHEFWTLQDHIHLPDRDPKFRPNSLPYKARYTHDFINNLYEIYDVIDTNTNNNYIHDRFMESKKEQNDIDPDWDFEDLEGIMEDVIRDLHILLLKPSVHASWWDQYDSVTNMKEYIQERMEREVVWKPINIFKD